MKETQEFKAATVDGAVEKGLKKGERIVKDGAHRVRKGMTVTPAPEK